MPKNTRGKIQNVRHVLHEIFRKHPGGKTMTQLEQLVISSGKLPVEWVENVQERALRNAIRKLIEETSFVDAQGQKIRTYQKYTLHSQGPDGKEVQTHLWDEIHELTHRQMSLSYNSRVNMANDIKQQAEHDRSYWNKEVAPKLGERPIKPRKI
ncbi:MAG TPA: hypothetical protein VMY37_04485 [Thermoguttaceae bacterium]|nr:hypothetical protein [Thermoguttaceae bacterium]